MSILSTLAPSLISAGASLVGGALDRSHADSQQRAQNVATANLNRTNRNFVARWNTAYLQDARRSREWQQQFATSMANRQNRQFELLRTRAMQDRVADARRAGVHPLAALGVAPSGATPTNLFQAGSASPSALNTAPIPGQYSSGSAIGDGVRQAGVAIAQGIADRRAAARQRRIDAQSAELHRANLGVLGSQKNRNNAEAQYYESRAAKATQEANARGRDQVAAAEATVHAMGPPRTLKRVRVPPHERAGTHDVRESTIVGPGGVHWKVGARSPAEDWELFYGEPGEWAAGAAGFVEDAYSNSVARFRKVIRPKTPARRVRTTRDLPREGLYISNRR